MNFFTVGPAFLCASIISCGAETNSDLHGIDNTLTGNDRLQIGGIFNGTGTLISSRCDAACAPSYEERLVLFHSRAALSVRIGATNYPATFDGDTVAWRANIANGPCDGSGAQIGAVTLSDTGGKGTRTNISTTHCNHTFQSCACAYAMAYVRSE